MVVFTSGTTGRPKGVQHSGRSLAATVAGILEHVELPSDGLVYDMSLHNLVSATLSGVPTHIAPLRHPPPVGRDGGNEGSDHRLPSTR